jgi:hypothetical protein
MAVLQQPTREESEGQNSRAKNFAHAAGNKRGKLRTQRGALKAKTVGALRAATQRGLTIRELSDKLRVKPANLYVWFNGTGRKTKGVKKLGPAKYRFIA